MSGEEDYAVDPDDLGPPEYLAYRVLHERKSQHGGETGRTQFHKLCCLTDKHLKEDFDREIGFPKHWYKYGRMAHEGLISSEVTFTPQANYKSGQAYYPADRVNESDFDHLSEDLRDDIFSAAQDIVQKHGDKTAEELEEFQYKNDAPNDFVKAYGDLRLRIAARIVDDEEQASFDSFRDDREKTLMEDLLDDMLVNFPEDDYEGIYDEYLLWDDTFRLLHEQDASARVLHEFLETFIEQLSKTYLRFEDNSNIPEEEIEKWEEEREEEIEKLEKEIRKRRDAAMEGRVPTNELDSVAEAYNETIAEEIEKL